MASSQKTQCKFKSYKLRHCYLEADSIIYQLEKLLFKESFYSSRRSSNDKTKIQVISQKNFQMNSFQVKVDESSFIFIFLKLFF